MAKTITIQKQHDNADIQNLSERDRDLLTLDSQQVIKKYNIKKQSVYNRKSALNKKILEAGLSLKDVLNDTGKKVAEKAKKAVPKKVIEKRGKKPELKEKQEELSTDIVRFEKSVPVIFKPIEINFGKFFVKLNGVPRHISVNPDTNAVEIDL